MGPNPLDGAGPEKLPAQGCTKDHQEAFEAEGVGDMGVSSASDSNEGGGL